LRPELGTHLVLEQKYLTSPCAGDVRGEHYERLSQGAQDISAYDVVKDIARVERFVGDKRGWSGAVLVLTNDPSYWTRPGHGRATNADAFRIYEGNQRTGSRAWGTRTGGTMKGREAPIELAGNHTCAWTQYSTLPGNRGRFRLLSFTRGLHQADRT
jgi:hypothetical protein